MRRLLTVLLLLALPAQSWGWMGVHFAGGGVPAGATACAAADYLPSADTDADTWARSTGSTHYEILDQARGSESTANYVYKADNPGTASDTVRVSLPGNCDVTSVRVYLFAFRNGADPITVTVDISADNTNWTATQNYSINEAEGAAASKYNDYAVTWATPSYIYVRFKPNSSTYNTVYISAMQTRVNN